MITFSSIGIHIVIGGRIKVTSLDSFYFMFFIPNHPRTRQSHGSPMEIYSVRLYMHIALGTTKTQ